MVSPNSNSFRRSLLACAVAAGLALSAAGTQAQMRDNPSPKASTETKHAEKDARKSWEQTHRASKIIGSEVRNAQDEKVGRVKDLVLADPSSGTISHVVVAVGGVAGMGDKLFAVPYSQIQSNPGKDYLVLSGSSDLSKAFDEKNWPNQAAWHERSDTARSAAMPASTPAPSSPPPASPPAPASPPVAAPSVSSPSPTASSSPPATTQ